MKALRSLVPLWVVACTSTVEPACPSGQVLGYPQGCGAVARCVADTSGDAIAIAFCGCDGVTHATSQWFPTQRWSAKSACGGDSGVDVPPADAASDVANDLADAATTCPRPAGDDACASDADCATVARGCYCGQQPVNGVARANLAAAARCEDEARRGCALGCPNAPGQVAQDGRSPGDGGTIAVRCERTDAGTMACRSYVP